MGFYLNKTFSLSFPNKLIHIMSDTEEVDLLTVPEGWEDPGFKEEEFKSHILVESSFSTLFPKYREKYFKEKWTEIEAIITSHNVKAECDLRTGQGTVTTTRKTKDPQAIFDARDFIKSMARGVDLEVAKRLFTIDQCVEMIKIDSYCQNQDKFKKRRQRLVGQNLKGSEGQTLKALELLTGCYILPQGRTVTVIGKHAGVKAVRRVVVDCMSNKAHPVHHVRRLMIQEELKKNPAMKNESWDRFLPPVHHTSQTKHKKKPRKEKKPYVPFPPAQPASKMDKEIESGEYFLKEEKRMKSLVAPKEKTHVSKETTTTKKRKAEADVH